MDRICNAMRRTIGSAVLAACATAPLAAWSQASSSADKSSATTRDATPAPQTARADKATPGKQAARTDKYARVRAEELIGMDVRDNGGRRMGDIEDVMIDTASGKLAYAVVGYGGFMGLGDRLYAYPTSAFAINLQSGTLTLKLPNERLKAAEGFDRNQWPADASYWDRITNVFSGDRTPVDPQRPHLVRASVLVGMDVNDSRGQDVGEVADVIVNLGKQKVDDVVLAFDEAGELGGKLVALPMKEFQPLTARSEELTVKRDREALRRAPTFDRNQWPDLTQGGLRERYESYWNNAPTPVATHSAAFERIDQNRDGFLTADEYKASFSGLDANGDGRVSRAEMDASPADVRAGTPR